MTPRIHYALLIIATIVGLHLLVSYASEDYAHTVKRITYKVLPYQAPGGGHHVYPLVPEVYRTPYVYMPPERKANAVFVFLAKNVDVNEVAESVKQLEDRFNKKYRYPYVFLNEQPFNDEFKTRISDLTDAEVKFGLISTEQWTQPTWINETRATAARKKMFMDKVVYGGSVPYRNMCRYNSGFFYRHELLQQYEYYWRVEPRVKFFCDLDYDPFLYMQDNDKVYGWTIALHEYAATIPTLWDEVRAFMKNTSNSQYIAPNNALEFLSDDGGATFNMCHFWSNFEIASFSLWRSPAYSAFFDHLDRAGGFYYERWGEAVVHSIAVGLLVERNKIHFFDDIGYRHEQFQHCPQGEAHKRGKCWCDERQTFDYTTQSCKRKFDQVIGR